MSIAVLASCSGFQSEQSNNRTVRRPTIGSPVADRNGNMTTFPGSVRSFEAAANQVEEEKGRQQAQLSIAWLSTDILEDSLQHAVLLNEFVMNGKRIATTTRLDWSGENGNGNIKNCFEDNLPYAVDFNDQQVGSDYWAIGKTECLIDGEVHVGLDFFAWNERGLISEKVLINISDATLASLITKEFSLDQNRTYLPDWIKRQLP
jgi:hypothetical protein